VYKTSSISLKLSEHFPDLLKKKKYHEDSRQDKSTTPCNDTTQHKSTTPCDNTRQNNTTAQPPVMTQHYSEVPHTVKTVFNLSPEG
jgi:hypothetical protein